jgi:hypothetical protein
MLLLEGQFKLADTNRGDTNHNPLVDSVGGGALFGGGALLSSRFFCLAVL